MKTFIERLRKKIETQKRQYYYEPLQITFFLQAPLSLTYPFLFFDSLVGRQMLMIALGHDFYLLPTKIPITKYIPQEELPPFPIKQSNELFHCSVAQFNGQYRIEYLYKRFEDRWANFKRKITRGSGYFRDYMIQHLYVAAPVVHFYACADYEMMKKICATVTGLGDNTRIGWGAVAGFKIDRISKDCSIVKNGIAMRPIPQRFLKSASEIVPMTWRSPYWDLLNVELCAPPGAEVILKQGGNK